jgi:hypothetical protein
MSTNYVIYHIETTQILHRDTWRPGYATEYAAKAALTRAVKKGLDRSQYAICEASKFYGTIEKKVTRTNLMSGQPYEVGVNEPWTTQPCSETYWSS